MKVFLILAAMVLLTACSPTYRDKTVPISSIVSFDAERYQGLWYEVAAFPNPFQSGCTDTTADYGVDGDGSVTVRNRCLKNGMPEVIEGRALITGPGRLSVRLDGVPVAADYWVLWVDEGYRTAVVGVPSGRVGWILNRSPDIPADRLAAARDVLAFNGYDVTRLRMTRQGTR